MIGLFVQRTANCELGVPWKLVFPIVHSAIFVDFSHLRFYCNFFRVVRERLNERERERRTEHEMCCWIFNMVTDIANDINKQAIIEVNSFFLYETFY